MILYKINNQIYYEDIGGTGEIRGVPGVQVEFDDNSAASKITISIFRYQDREHKNFFRENFDYDAVLDADGVAYGDSFDKVTRGYDGGIDVNNQDQTTDEVIVKFNKVSQSTTLAVEGAIDEKTITLTSATGAVAGKYIILFHPASKRFSTFTQVGAAAGSVITLDSRLDFAYPVGTLIDLADTNMAVDGSVTPQTFGLRGVGVPPGIDIDFDMTRIAMSCLTATAVDLSKFGDLDALTHGLEFRMRNGRYHNSFNIKSNREIDAIFGTDWKPYQAINPQQGQDGFTARLTYAGMDKIGVAKRMPIGDDFEITVQEDLLTVQSASRQITLLEIWAEGHITEP